MSGGGDPLAFVTAEIGLALERARRELGRDLEWSRDWEGERVVFEVAVRDDTAGVVDRVLVTVEMKP